VTTRIPPVLAVAAGLVLVEAAAIAVFGMVELVSLDTDRPTVALTSGGFFLLYAAMLAFAAIGLTRLRTWSRSMIVMAQVIQLALAWSFRGGDTGWVAWVLAVPALAALALVFSPPATEALFGSSAGNDEDTSRERS
jgi:hypothetical protein